MKKRSFCHASSLKQTKNLFSEASNQPNNGVIDSREKSKIISINNQLTMPIQVSYSSPGQRTPIFSKNRGSCRLSIYPAEAVC